MKGPSAPLAKVTHSLSTGYELDFVFMLVSPARATLTMLFTVYGFFFDADGVPLFFGTCATLAAICEVIRSGCDPGVVRFWSSQSCVGNSYYF
jgi:hypothetical protein